MGATAARCSECSALRGSGEELSDEPWTTCNDEFSSGSGSEDGGEYYGDEREAGESSGEESSAPSGTVHRGLRVPLPAASAVVGSFQHQMPQTPQGLKGVVGGPQNGAARAAPNMPRGSPAPTAPWRGGSSTTAFHEVGRDALTPAMTCRSPNQVPRATGTPSTPGRAPFMEPIARQPEASQPQGTVQSASGGNVDESFDAAGQQAANDDEENYRNIDLVYEDPQTGAQIFIGNIYAAQDAELLSEHRISRVVNCQQSDSLNFFEGDPQFRYLRFPVASWQHEDDVSSSSGVLRFFEPLFRWVDDAVAKRENVLIHCLAGMHRAGSVGVATIMHLTGKSSADVLREVQQKRPSVQLVLGLVELMRRLDAAMGHKQLYG
mmetsp:Transcript_52782/g.114052  ORF Transcript_52782/g.114052 Transcript_52782/m.114052 type:complete len:378 (+) Transcript_52782:25-1158(+)